MPNTMPGVTVSQIATPQAVTSTAPDLRPVVVGVCRQIVGITDEDGLPNPDAQFVRAYDQASMAIPQASFPDPRGNIDELNVEEDRVSAGLVYGGRLRELERGSHGTRGSAFLQAVRGSRRAGIRSSEHTSFAFDGTVGDRLTFALDVVNANNTTQDVTVTLLGTLTSAEVVAAINLAAGEEVAEVVSHGGHDYVQIASTVRGATSSVTIRAGTSALTKLFGDGFDDAQTYRVEGAGFAAQDDDDGDLTSPWIEWKRGGWYVSGTLTDFPAAATADHAWPVLLDLDDEAYVARTAAMTFTGTSATIPLRGKTATLPGDLFYADGVVPVSGAEVIRVESGRFKLGVLNADRTTYADGIPVTRAYDPVEVNTLNDPTPLAPADATFIAQGLVAGESTATAASRTGEYTGLVARPAMLLSGVMSFPVNLASLTLNYRVTVGGVDGEDMTLTFTGGPFANIGAVVDVLETPLNDAGVLVTSNGNRLLFATNATGAGAGLTILSSGTANSALGLSTSASVSDSGKDEEAAERAIVSGLPILLPVKGTYDLNISVADSKGTHLLAGEITLDDIETESALRTAIAAVFGGASGDYTLYEGVGGEGTGGIPVATVSVVSNTEGTVQVVLRTVEGGSGVELAVDASSVSEAGRILGFYDADMGVPATLVADVVSDFGAMRGGINPGTHKQIQITTTGLASDLAAASISIGGSGAQYLPDVCTALQTALNTALVGAGNATGLVTVAWNRADDMVEITITGATEITITTGVTNDLAAVLFGVGFTETQSGATWQGEAPDVDYLEVRWNVVEVADPAPTQVSTALTLAEVQEDTTAADVARYLNGDDAANGITDLGHLALHWYVTADGALAVRTIEGGAGATLENTGDTEGIEALGFSDTASDAGAAGDNALDVGADLLIGEVLRFFLDDNPHAYRVAFSTNSLVDAAAEVNEVVGGATDVAAVEDRALVLSSLLAGAASSVEVDSPEGEVAGEILGLTGRSIGSGRPEPDFYLDDTGMAVIGPSILRDQVTGRPYDLIGAGATLYIGYRAVRLDVTARGTNPGILAFSTLVEAEAAIGPFTTENPLGLGVMLAMGAAPGRLVYAYGVDAADDAAPTGTYDAWIRALQALEAAEVYAIAPMTDDVVTLTALAAHVTEMSTAAGRKERIGVIWTPVPDRAVAETVASGTGGRTNGTDNSFTCDLNPSSALLAAGVNPAAAIPLSEDVYLEMRTVDAGATQLRRLSVSRLNSTVLTLRTTFSASENTDGFYDTSPLAGDLGLTNQSWSLKIRGDRLVIRGTTMADKNAIADAGAAEARIFSNNRIYYLYAAAVEVSIAGTLTRVPAYYAAAVISGMISVRPISGALTDLALTGLGRCYGTDDGTLTPVQISALKDGGRMVLGSNGAATTCLQSVSTKTGTAKDAELTVRKCLDRIAKRLRNTLRYLTGGDNVVNANWIAMVSATLQSVLQDELDNQHSIAGYGTPAVLQDEADPTATTVDVEVAVLYPANRIHIRISY